MSDQGRRIDNNKLFDWLAPPSYSLSELGLVAIILRSFMTPVCGTYLDSLQGLRVHRGKAFGHCRPFSLLDDGSRILIEVLSTSPKPTRAPKGKSEKTCVITCGP